MRTKRSTRRGAVGARAAVVIILASLSVSLSQAEEQTAPVTLTQAIAAALEGGPDAKVAELNLGVARAQYEQAVARNAPSLSGNASFGHSDSETTGGGPGPSGQDSLQGSLSFSAPRTLTSASLSASHTIVETDPLDQSTGVTLSVNQTIWDGYGSPLDGGKSAASARQSEIALRGRELSALSSRQDIISRVKQSYYALLSAQHAAAARQGALEQQRAQLARTQALTDNQLASSLELRQAQLNARSAELDLAAANDNLVVARRKLSALLGWPADRLYGVAEAPDPVAPPLDMKQLLATAIEKRIDVQQQKLNELSADINLALRKVQLSPTVSASGRLSLNQDWTTGALSVPWSLSVSVNVPVTDAGLAAAEVRETILSNEISRVQAEQLAATIATEVASAVYNVKDLLSRAALAADRLALAQTQYELAQAKLDQGVGSTLDVLDALVSLTNAQVSLSRAKADALLGILQLQDAIGTIEE